MFFCHTMSKNNMRHKATSTEELFLTANCSLAITLSFAACIIRLPKYNLFAKLKSASINRRARSLSTWITPGTFSIITDKPTHQRSRGLIRVNANSIDFACIEDKNGDVDAAL